MDKSAVMAGPGMSSGVILHECPSFNPTLSRALRRMHLYKQSRIYQVSDLDGYILTSLYIIIY